MAHGKPQELALVVGDLKKPACPTPRFAGLLGLGKLLDDRQCLITRGRAARQLYAFLNGQDAFIKPVSYGGGVSVRIGRGTATMDSWPMRSYSAIT